MKQMRKSEIKRLLYAFSEEIKHVTDLDQAADDVYDEYAPMPHDPQQRLGFELFVAGFAAKLETPDWPRGTLQVRENATPLKFRCPCGNLFDVMLNNVGYLEKIIIAKCPVCGNIHFVPESARGSNCAKLDLTGPGNEVEVDA